MGRTIADIEGRLLCRAIRDRTWVPLVEARITEDWFHDSEHRAVFAFVAKHYRDHGEVPTAAFLRTEFPNYTVVKIEDSLPPLIEQLQERRAYGRMVAALQDAGEALEENRDWRAARDQARTAITELDAELSTLQDVDLPQTWEARLAAYDERASRDGALLGIPTGFPTVDRATNGWQPSQLVTIIATPKVGKSTLMMRLALNAWTEGFRVLFISFEMSNEEQAARHDSMIGGMPHTSYLRGTLTEDQLEKLEIALAKTEGKQSFILSADISSVTTVSGVAAKIEQHAPDIVFVDGVYLMRDELGEAEGSPQALTNITRNLKRMGQRANIPVISSTQALLSKVNKKRGIAADSIGYCVDLETEVLTQRGWLRQPDLRVGDMAYALDHKTGAGVWSEVTAVNLFSAMPREMLRLSGPRSAVDALATSAHRWPVLQRTRRGLERQWRTSSTLNCNSIVPLSAASSEQPTEAKYSDALVELVAWLWTEGSIQSGGPSIITQSEAVNPANVSRIAACLTEVVGMEQDAATRVRPGSHAWRAYRRRANGCVDFWLSKAVTDDLQQYAPSRVPSGDFLRSLTRAQLELFWSVSMLADNNGEFALSQKSRARAESFMLLCVLTGRAASLHHEAPGPTTPEGMWRVSMRKVQGGSPLAVATGSASRADWVSFDGPVWCPTTQHGTWMARRNGRAYFTGNSSSFAQDSDVVLGLQPHESDDENMRELRVVMSRNCGRVSTTCIWDWESSTFEEEYREGWDD